MRKKPSNLRRVEVDGDDPREAGRLDEPGDDPRSHGFPAGCPPILTGVPEVRDDRRYAGRPGTAAGIGQKEQFHDVLVDRQTGRLNDVDIMPADAVFDFHVQLAVGEALQDSRTRSHAKVLGDARRQRHVG